MNLKKFDYFSFVKKNITISTKCKMEWKRVNQNDFYFHEMTGFAMLGILLFFFQKSTKFFCRMCVTISCTAKSSSLIETIWHSIIVCVLSGQLHWTEFQLCYICHKKLHCKCYSYTVRSIVGYLMINSFFNISPHKIDGNNWVYLKM